MFRKYLFFSMIAVLFFSCRAMANKPVFLPASSFFSKFDIFDCRTGKFASVERFEDEVLESDIIYSLESHYNIGHHIIQKELAEFIPWSYFDKAVFAHEFFIKNCYGHQVLLDRLSRREITLNEFLDSVKYNMDATKELLPVFEMIARGNIKPLAISIPMPFPDEIIPESTVILKNLRGKIFNKNWPDDKKMFPAQEMLDESYKNLTESEKSFLPRDGFKILCSENLHKFLLPSFRVIDKCSKISPEERHLSYCLMNEIMARSIIDFLDANNDYKMVVGAGINHGIFKSGIRSSVAARKPELKQLTILPAMNENFSADNEFIKSAVECGLADYVLIPKKECGKNEISLPLPEGNFKFIVKEDNPRFIIKEGSLGKADLTRSLIEGGIAEEEALKAIEGLVECKSTSFTDAEMTKFFCIINTTWDTGKDAEEFFDAYAKMTSNTMGKCRIVNGTFIWEKDNFKRAMERVGVRVEITAEMIVE